MFARGLLIFAVAVGFLAVPAWATITYTFCSGGCSSTGGSYATWQTAPGTTGLAFSSLTTFISGDLSGTPALYTDTSSGAIFTGYSNSTTTSALSVSGTNLNLGVTGTGAGIQLTLPANTYAVAMVLSLASGNAFNLQAVEVGDRNVTASNYAINVSSVGTGVFFGIVSDAPLTSLFFGNTGNLEGPPQIQSFELGEPAPAPEIATCFMIGGGLIGLFLLRRRQGTIPPLA